MLEEEVFQPQRTIQSSRLCTSSPWQVRQNSTQWICGLSQLNHGGSQVFLSNWHLHFLIAQLTGIP